MVRITAIGRLKLGLSLRLGCGGSQRGCVSRLAAPAAPPRGCRLARPSKIAATRGTPPPHARRRRGRYRQLQAVRYFLKRPPDSATVEDIRLFQLHLAETGMSSCNRNRIMTGVRFLFRVTMGRLDLAAEIHHLREPEKIALVMSPDKTIAEFICSGRRKQRFSRKSAHRLYAFRFFHGRRLTCLGLFRAAVVLHSSPRRHRPGVEGRELRFA